MYQKLGVESLGIDYYPLNTGTFIFSNPLKQINCKKHGGKISCKLLKVKYDCEIIQTSLIFVSED
jgi:hypothetical protein